MPKSIAWRLAMAAFLLFDGVVFLALALTSREGLLNLNMVSALLFVAAGILTGVSAFTRKTPAKPSL
jgi:hypothetical protein